MPTNTWKDLKVQKNFLDNLHRQLELKSFDDWYHVKQQDIKEHGGTGLLQFYGNSIKRSIFLILSHRQNAYERVCRISLESMEI